MSRSSSCRQAIGFDMDYTLSQYRPETFEVLAYNLTVNKLINNFYYPKVRSLSHTSWSALLNNVF